MSSSSSSPEIREIENCRNVLRIFSDKSILRSSSPSFPLPLIHSPSVEFSDAIFDPDLKLPLRIFRPKSPPLPNLPIFFYFHGGGFCIGSRTWPNFHNFCLRLSSQIPAIILAPDYRLSPESPLPAPILDSFSSILWLRSQSLSPNPHPFLLNADFNNLFVSGDSAGANLAHHIALKFSDQTIIEPICIRGYVLLMPFFGGVERTESEENCPEEAFLNLELSDRFWRLALPVGGTRDDPVANPFGPGGPDWGTVRVGPMVVVVGGEDLLRDRGVEYGERLRELGNPVEVVRFEGQQHGFFTLEPESEPAGKLVELICRFVDRHRCKVD